MITTASRPAIWGHAAFGLTRSRRSGGVVRRTAMGVIGRTARYWVHLLVPKSCALG